MTAMAPTVGLALIARNEQDTLPTLLESIDGAFDRVVLLDTGSTDDTVQVFTAWCNRQALQRPRFTHQTASYEWRDDFAHARECADRLLLWGDPDADDQTRGAVQPMVEWACWADCDDQIAGAHNLRAIAAQAPPHVAGFVFDYSYAHDQHGNVICTLRRERLLRAGVGRWTGRVHEALLFQGEAVPIDPNLCRWVHRKPARDGETSNDRNLRILHAWNTEQPDDPRIIGYLGTEHAGRGELAEAITWFRRYLELKDTWDEERCQIHRKLAACLIDTGQPAEAIEVALQALKVMPSWPDTYLSLAQATQAMGEHGKAVEWAREVLRRGQPQTLLIINPLDYTLAPRLVLAGSLGELGHIDDALHVCEEALAIVPGHQALVTMRQQLRVLQQRESTASTWCGAAQMLISHDEQLKALRLLEDTCPYWVQDHPRVVALRSQLRERLLPVLADTDSYARAYEGGGVKPEAPVPDDQIAAVCERLPRAGFVARGLAEQLDEMREAA